MKDPIDSSRRAFVKGSAVLGAGLVVAFVIPGGNRFARAASTADGIFAPNAFLRIAPDSSVTILLGHSEMGQGIWTGLSMLVAEELDADWNSIRVEHGPASAADYGLPGFGGMQITGGSTSTWMEFDRYRLAGAAARLMLIEAAAKRFNVAPSQIRTEPGVVIAGEQRATYGELANDAGQLPVPDAATITLKQPKDWTLIGKPTPRLDTPEKITGQARFGIDVQFDGLLTAMVARPPMFGGSVASFDAQPALAISGVRKVLQVPTGVAVVADHYWAAKLGRDALKIDWNPGPNAGLDSVSLLQRFRQLATTPGTPASQAGDVDAGLAKASKIIDVEYSVPYLAHAPMEPLNCTVKISAEQCEIWTGTQFQTLDQRVAAKITGLKPEQVVIHTEFLGGGFGRRANPTSDFVSEAVQVAHAAGAAVKTLWAREDDIRGGYYRSAFLHHARIGLGDDGMPVAWKQVMVGQSIMAGTSLAATMVKDGIDKTSVEGVVDSPYLTGLADHQVQLHSPQTGISVLWLRSVGHSHTAFVMESLVDELAAAAGKDPVEYRRTLLKDQPRHLGVLNLAVEKANWKAPLPAGHALGVAVHESFGSYVAQVSEVSQDNLKIRVHRVVCAVDCGIAVNPLSIVAQMESCITFGLGFTLHSKLTIKEGQVEQSNYHDYQVLRLNEMPQVEVHILPSSEKPGGIGEAGVPPTAPAVANAVYALTGQRLRELPLQLEGV